MFAKLIVTKKSDPEWHLERIFEQEVISLGRDRTNSIRLADDTKYISRHHAELIRDIEVYRLIDPGSLNQTLLNDVQIAENIPYALRSGDIITIGDYLIHFLYVEEPEVEDAKSEEEIEPYFDEELVGLSNWLKRLQKKFRGEDREYRREMLRSAFSIALNDPDITDFGLVFEEVIRDIASDSQPALQTPSNPDIKAPQAGTLDEMEDPATQNDEITLDNLPPVEDEITLDKLPQVEDEITLDNLPNIDGPEPELELEPEEELTSAESAESSPTLEVDQTDDFSDLVFPQEESDVSDDITLEPDVSDDITLEPDVSDDITLEPDVSDDITLEPDVSDDITLEPDVSIIIEDDVSSEDMTADFELNADDSTSNESEDSDTSIFIEPGHASEDTGDIQSEDSDTSIFLDPEPSMLEDSDTSVFLDPDPSMLEDSDTSIFIDPEPSIVEDPDPSITVEQDPEPSIIIDEDDDLSFMLESDIDESASDDNKQPESEKPESQDDTTDEKTFRINSPDDTLIIPEGFRHEEFVRSMDETHDDLINSEYPDLKISSSSDEITFSDEVTNQHVIPPEDATEDDVTPLTLEGQLPRTPRTEIIIIDDPVETKADAPQEPGKVKAPSEPPKEPDETAIGEEHEIDNQLFDEDDDTFETLNRKSSQELPDEEGKKSADPSIANVPNKDLEESSENNLEAEEKSEPKDFAFDPNTAPIEPELPIDDSWINLDDSFIEQPEKKPKTIPLLDQTEDIEEDVVEVRLTETDSDESLVDVEVIYPGSPENPAEPKEEKSTQEEAKPPKQKPADTVHTGHRSRRGQDVRVGDPYEIAKNLGNGNNNDSDSSRIALEMMINAMLDTYRTTEQFQKDFIKLSNAAQGSFGSSTAEELHDYLFDPSINDEESLDRLRKIRQKFDDVNLHHQAVMDGYWASITEGREIILENIDIQRIKQEIGNQYFYIVGIRIPTRFLPIYVKKKAYKTLENRVNSLITENRQNFQKKVFWPSFVRAYTKRIGRNRAKKKQQSDYQR